MFLKLRGSGEFPLITHHVSEIHNSATLWLHYGSERVMTFLHWQKVLWASTKIHDTNFAVLYLPDRVNYKTLAQ